MIQTYHTRRTRINNFKVLFTIFGFLRFSYFKKFSVLKTIDGFTKFSSCSLLFLNRNLSLRKKKTERGTWICCTKVFFFIDFLIDLFFFNSSPFLFLYRFLLLLSFFFFFFFFFSFLFLFLNYTIKFKKDYLADPIETVKKTYEHFGYTYTQEFEDR